jgi:hypothetical protein
MTSQAKPRQDKTRQDKTVTRTKKNKIVTRQSEDNPKVIARQSKVDRKTKQDKGKTKANQGKTCVLAKPPQRRTSSVVFRPPAPSDGNITKLNLNFT